MKLWDFFMAHGYKGVFKAAIYLLKTFETVLYQLNFEQVLAFIPQTPRFIFMPNEEEEDQTNEKMTRTLLMQSIQSKDDKITEAILEIQKVDLVNCLHDKLNEAKVSSYILEKLDLEYYNSQKIHPNGH
jgi:hypothetical protein